MARCHYGWVVVIGACLTNFLLVGMSRSMGILYSSVLVTFGESAAASATFLSIYNTLRMVLGPLASVLCERFGCRPVVILGGALFSLGFILSSFAVNLLHLNICFGVVGGIGGAFVFTPPYIIVGQYFEKKKGQAMSLSTIGAGIGTISLAPLQTALLGYYGHFGSWLITGGIMLNICVAGALFRPKSINNSKSECDKIELVVEADQETEGNELQKCKQSDEINDNQHSGKHNYSTPLPVENGTTTVKSDEFKLPVKSDINPLNKIINFSDISSKSTGHVDKIGCLEFSNCEATSHPALMRVRSNTTTSGTGRPRAHKGSNLFSSTSSLNYAKKLKEAEIYCSMDRISIYSNENYTTKEISANKSDLIKNETEKDNSRKRINLNFLKMLTNVSYITYLINIAVMPFAMMTSMIYLPSLALEIGVPSENSVGLLLSIMGVSDVIGRFVSGLIFDIKQIRVPKRRRLVFGIYGLLFSSVTFALGFCPSFITLICCTFLYGIFEGGYHAQRMTILSEFLTPAQIAGAVGWSIFAQGTGNMISTPVSGYLKDVFGTFRYGFYCGGGFLCVASCLIILDYLWQTRKKEHL